MRRLDVWGSYFSYWRTVTIFNLQYLSVIWLVDLFILQFLNHHQDIGEHWNKVELTIQPSTFSCKKWSSSICYIVIWLVESTLQCYLRKRNRTYSEEIVGEWLINSVPQAGKNSTQFSGSKIQVAEIWLTKVGINSIKPTFLTQ